MSETDPPPPKRKKTTQGSLTSFVVNNKIPRSQGQPKEDGPAAALESGTAKNDPTKNDSFEPICPEIVPLKGKWGVCKDKSVLYRLERNGNNNSNNKVAGFDLSGTLVDSVKQYPNALGEYELWNTQAIEKLRKLHDDEHYRLVVFANQGKIKGAMDGKTATTTKNLIEWLASKIDRPLSAFVSTNTQSGFHKPSTGLWTAAEEILHVNFNVASSLYVGDSVDSEEHPGADEQFARNVGDLKNAALQFSTPDDFFGPSNKDKRIELRAAEKQLEYDEPPTEALQARAALSGGYLFGPIMLVLCGPQGSGKSFFSNLVTYNNSHWKSFSQDTIRNGRPGSRENVEQAVEVSLKNGFSVVVDRMHLDETQRSYFVSLAKSIGVPVHALVLKTPKKVVSERVLNRENHVVSGNAGAGMAEASWMTLAIPKYSEGFTLIIATGTNEGVKKISDQYRRVLTDSPDGYLMVPDAFDCPSGVAVPSVALGTFRLGKRIASESVRTATKLGFLAFDTAPTYNNEDLIGPEMSKTSFCIAKVPKRATTSDKVYDELATSLIKLNREQADLLLLHWPCDVIALNTLKDVWEAMEESVKQGKVKALGVCNFNIGALRLLLKVCPNFKPIVNQVERHPLLQQWDLVDFCAQHDILLQAHTSLGQGSSELLGHSVVQEVSHRSGLSAAQVVLQWNLLQNVPVVVKCASEVHMKDVLGVRSGKVLSPDDIKALNEVSETKRFVAPPFMYGNEVYQWKND